MDLVAQTGIAPGSYLLDVGCGIGGPSRYFAGELGGRGAGIDITEEYVRVAETLAQRVGMGGAVSYRRATALQFAF